MHEKCAGLIINFPTTLMESEKRAARNYNDNVESKLTIILLIIIVNNTIFILILAVLITILMIYEFYLTSKQRSHELQNLLVIPRSSIHRIVLILTTAVRDQELDENATLKANKNVDVVVNSGGDNENNRE